MEQIYQDRSFDFIIKTPPTAVLIKKALKLEKGSAEPQKDKVATINQKQITEIAKKKLPDLNTDDLEQAKNEFKSLCESDDVSKKYLDIIKDIEDGVLKWDGAIVLQNK